MTFALHEQPPQLFLVLGKLAAVDGARRHVDAEVAAIAPTVSGSVAREHLQPTPCA